jgi:hypothetical protein
LTIIQPLLSFVMKLRTNPFVINARLPQMLPAGEHHEAARAATTLHSTRWGGKWVGPISCGRSNDLAAEEIEMGRLVVSVALLVLVGCTGAKLPVRPPSSLARPAPGSSTRTRTTLEMEVGPSVHPGSFRAMGTLTDAAGAPLAQASIKVTLTAADGASPSTFELGTRVTDARGSFQVTFHLPEKGRFVVDAWFSGNDRYEPAHDQGPVAST